MSSQTQPTPGSSLAGPIAVPAFEKELDRLVALARKGHKPGATFNNPSEEWLISQMHVLQDLSEEEQQKYLDEASIIDKEAAEANAAGKAAGRAWPGVVIRLDTGGYGFFSQLGVVRRPDLTQYFIDGFAKNRDGVVFTTESQTLFTAVFGYINSYMEEKLAAGDTIVQSDRQVGDAPGRSFHARQMLFGTRYMQIPMMWRQLTFPASEELSRQEPDILEVSLPHWMEDLPMPEELKKRLRDAGLTQLVFKAPTKGLSLHLGFDYVGEHKMGPLSIAMFKVKQVDGLAIQAALSMARAKTMSGQMKNTALITVGPSLHGKSTLTIMLELANSELAGWLKLKTDAEEGVYPMNDDIVLLQPLKDPVKATRDGKQSTLYYGIDGTENNLYAMPFGLNKAEDPITFEAVRGTDEDPNSQETLENVPIDLDSWSPNFLSNPVRNMRVTLSRTRLVARKGANDLLKKITNGRETEGVHVPIEDTDQVFWQAVMRQNTVVPPLRRLSPEQYIRILMYGEAVQMGAAIGAIGRPYVEYFSDPFIIGLEDENANNLYTIVKKIEEGGLSQQYFVFNTGGVGADTNDQASGAHYKKIPRELTLMLQEALLRDAVKFEYEDLLGSDLAVAIVDEAGNEVVDLRNEWLPKNIYGEKDYSQRITELSRRRFYGESQEDKAGILRYTKVVNRLYDLSDIPVPANERELAWLLSFFWNVDQAYETLAELRAHVSEGNAPVADVSKKLQDMYAQATGNGLSLDGAAAAVLSSLGF
ncbi:MAG TPA: phosphoenolpyruvate carboxykinase (ATP) [Dehalococcoidia bacterium]|nr:phosphoenolpyruvate carboxykinase (ATP) [Dehalococcoidia bacterium]